MAFGAHQGDAGFIAGRFETENSEIVAHAESVEASKPAIR